MNERLIEESYESGGVVELWVGGSGMMERELLCLYPIGTCASVVGFRVVNVEVQSKHGENTILIHTMYWDECLTGISRGTLVSIGTQVFHSLLSHPSFSFYLLII